jgi:hypothetical protein
MINVYSLLFDDFIAALQRNVTSFSRKGVLERGDSSVWTQSPLDKDRPSDPVLSLLSPLFDSSLSLSGRLFNQFTIEM